MLQRIFAFTSIVFLFLVFIGCAQKEAAPIVLDLPPQNLGEFVKDFKVLENVESKKQDYLKHFFSPWDKKSQLKAKDVKWGLEVAYFKQGFGENLQPYSIEEIQALELESNFDTFPSVKKPAIITRNTHLRVLPTNKPRFLNPKLAGEGFPFDYWQNSYIYLGTPVLITHYSRSKAWAYVESGFVSGWVSVLDVGILNDIQIKTLKKTKDFLIAKRDYISLKNTHNEFLENARIGMLLPLIGSTKTQYETEIYERDGRGYAHAVRIALDKNDFVKFPMAFSSANVARLAQNLIGEKYGWGGMFGNRDCSMLLRDVLGNFGFYLLRNSQAQMHQNAEQKSILYKDISKQNPKEKIESIKKYGIPFATLLGMKGHIMLYLGEKNGEIYVLHDVWGLRTLQNETQEGRKIIGKIVITSLEVGKDVKGIKQDSLLLHRLYGMRNLFSKEVLESE
ncbi:SH3 domain-containing C40 family peptidase [Helicobacter turcicus]|uniref:SH3 domain-containing protein n=1 Tax=Helicobacter turcicus TaxID=2867412 RepID=A0ABS7JL60_9HELI|nr:SH3 domain-containing C40 family peptidase [Helicobacter turcicus]MBX7490117.1 SH3 domain-containing protein [Helicobacter turcicus]MBX7544976.1 SH3 domain-containing protein [Helicobacter turcicus]